MAQAIESGDRFAAARAVADAVLYEGYVLYPYRASSQKNRLRWQFGVVVPPAWSAADTSERHALRTECVLAPGTTPRLHVRVRCLQVQQRTVDVVGDLSTQPAPLVPWDEVVEHTVDLPVQVLSPPVTASRVEQFRLPPADAVEPVRSPAGELVARVVRRREPVDGRVTVEVVPADDFSGLLRVRVTVENTTSIEAEAEGGAPSGDRDAMLRRSLVAVHTMLAVDDGCFVSSLDPPVHAGFAVYHCDNDGLFPVLVGAGDDVVLAAPIVLYDHPAVAPESPGDLYDATEIDEILALRVLTLTDDEKAEARATDPRAAAIVDRVEAMAPERWQALHGAIRTAAGGAAAASADDVPWWDPGVDASVDPSTDSVHVAGVEVAQGSRVRLRPSRRADAQDLFLADQLATVAAVFRDVDGGDHVGVVLDADPNADIAREQGRFLYFAPDEVEPLDDRKATT